MIQAIIVAVCLGATPAEAWSSITAKEMQAHVYKLGSVSGGRSQGTAGNAEAADYIEGMLKKNKLRTWRQTFHLKAVQQRRSERCQNIFTWVDLPSSQARRHEIVIVGAHRDSAGNAGADDNASGTAAVMELAQAFSMLPKTSIGRTVVFVLFDAEETGMHGSRCYVNNPVFPLGSPNMRNHVFMANFDMIGRYHAATFAGMPPHLVDFRCLIDKVSQRYPFAYRRVVQVGGPDLGRSDHHPFYQMGVPVCWFHTGTRHSYYHTRNDVPSTLDYSSMAAITRYAFEILMEAAKVGWQEEPNVQGADNDKSRDDQGG